MNSKVDVYLSKAKRWQEEMTALRTIILNCQLREELKWGKPCYSLEEGNVVLIVGFKDYCALLFCKGVLLKDTHGLLIKPGANTQATRQMRFTSIQEIVKMKSVLKAYLTEAIEVEKTGLEVDYKESTKLSFPPEFQKKLAENPALKTAFAVLTTGRQRAYNLHFSAPKQSKTRESRVEKCLAQILEGRGLNDQYLRSERRS